MDLILAFPFLLIMLALSGRPDPAPRGDSACPEGNPSRITYLILVLSLFGWPYLARIVRGQVLSLREREFVEASVAMGAGTRADPVQARSCPTCGRRSSSTPRCTLPTYIAAEAALSFLGVGVLPPTPTWGAMLADSVSYFNVVPAYLFIPGTCCHRRGRLQPARRLRPRRARPPGRPGAEHADDIQTSRQWPED